MSLIETIIVGGLTLVLLIWLVGRQIRSPHWASFVLSVLVLLVYVSLLRSLFGFPAIASAIGKGPGSNSLFPIVSAMFGCMILGMAAESLYHYLDAPPGKRQFDLGSFLKPFLVSPLVFMPLAASLQNANLDLTQFDAPRLMIFLVAFENGFLWRGYFSRKLGESQSVASGAGK